MFAKHPEIAKRWAEETPSITALPKKKPPKSKRRFKTQREVDDHVMGLLGG